MLLYFAQPFQHAPLQKAPNVAQREVMQLPAKAQRGTGTKMVNDCANGGCGGLKEWDLTLEQI